MASPGKHLASSKSHAAIETHPSKEFIPVLGLSSSRSCVKILSSPRSTARLSNSASQAKVATAEVVPPEGKLARDFFVDCGTHTFPYGDSYQIDPNLPGEAEVAAQREICDNVEDWTEALMDTIDDLLQWKDQMMALHALPTNAVAGLVLLSSRFCRCKGRLQAELGRMLDMTHSLIANLLLNTHIKQYKTNMIDMSVAMDNEKMVLAEEQCKLRAALAQLAHVKASHRMFRWARLSSRLREKELTHELDRQASAFAAKREEFHQVVKGQREQITALTETLATLKAAQEANTAPKTKIVLMPATASTQAKATRLKSAPIRSVGFERPTAPAPANDVAWEAMKSPNDPPTKHKRQVQQPPNNQDKAIDVGVAVVKPPARPRTSGATPRGRRQLEKHHDIPVTALEWRSPQDMAPDERHAHYKETWQERRDKQRDDATTKHMSHVKLDRSAPSPAKVHEAPETLVDPSGAVTLDVEDAATVVALAQGNNALINSLGVRKDKPKR